MRTEEKGVKGGRKGGALKEEEIQQLFSRTEQDERGKGKEGRKGNKSRKKQNYNERLLLVITRWQGEDVKALVTSHDKREGRKRNGWNVVVVVVAVVFVVVVVVVVLLLFFYQEIHS